MYIFPEYDWTFEHATYQSFKNGNIKCPYESRIYGVGYLGEGKYKAKKNGKDTEEYRIWYHMLRRCYSPKYQEQEPTYEGCTVENNWLNFQNMGKWIEENYYEISYIVDENTNTFKFYKGTCNGIELNQIDMLKITISAFDQADSVNNY